MVSAKKQGASAKPVNGASVGNNSSIRKKPVRKTTKKVGLPEVEQAGNEDINPVVEINPIMEVSYRSELDELRQRSRLLEDQVVKLQTELSGNSNRPLRIRAPEQATMSAIMPTSNEPLGYRMKIEKFKGGADEDYDVWWEDLQAFFALHTYSENDKIRLYNAHLGGEARKFLQNEDMEKIDTVNQLHELLRGTFSDKYDWQNVLMNIAQKPDEKIRPFSVRLRVAARKCGFQGPMLDNMCVNYLKRSCLRYLKSLLGNCLPGTPYDVVVEHAIQHERARELELETRGKRRVSNGRLTI